MPDLAYSHSIVNKPFFIFYFQWLIFLLIGNTMKDTMLRKSFKILGNFRLNTDSQYLSVIKQQLDPIMGSC